MIMSKKFSGENTLAYLVTLIKTVLGGKVDTTDKRLIDARTPTQHAETHGVNGTDPITPTSIGAVATDDIVNALDSMDSNKPLAAAQGKVLAEQIASKGDGDMQASIYDKDSDGIVDNAAALGGHSADYFATADSISSYVTGQKGQAGGIVPLEADKKINSIYLPSYVDDVLEGYYHDGFFYVDDTYTELIPGEAGKIYVDLQTDISYRYGGSTYVAITSSDMVEISNTEVQAIWDAAQ